MTENAATIPDLTAYDTMILVVPVDAYRAEHYGIAYESASLHMVKGPNVHNRSFNHTIQVWNNRDGKDPQGKDTDAARWVTTSARASMITSHPGQRAIYGDDLRIGGTVALIASDEDGVRFLGGFTVTNQFLSDPILTPADATAEATITNA